MLITGKTAYIEYEGKKYRFLNQRSPEWTHPYEYQPNSGDTLSNSGCGIFSLCFVAEAMSEQIVSPEELADFSCQHGGRGDDGTDRPNLLAALQTHGLAEKYGFEYRFDGHLNDHEALWKTLVEGGCALCNLRSGHIVALIGSRVVNHERQILALDSHSESGDSRISGFVREIAETSQVIFPIRNETGLITGYGVHYGMFWVPLTLAKDFDLLHPLSR